MLAAYAGANSVEEVRDVLVGRTARLGFRFVALVSPAAALALHNYPGGWVEEAAAAQAAIDPMFDAATRRVLPFFWRDPDVQAEIDPPRRALLERAAAFGLVDGFCVPIRAPGAPAAAGSVVPGADALEPTAYRLAHSEIVLAHERARSLIGAPPPRLGLTSAERSCLALAARGKTDWEIGAILGFTQRQVHHLIERVKARAGVTTRVQAIVYALASGEIAVSEALGDFSQGDFTGQG